MKKQIFRRILVVALLAIIASGVLFSFVLMGLNQRNIDRTSLSILRTVRLSFDENQDMNVYAKSLASSYVGMRVTIVYKDGTVKGDSQADVASMENHSQREEIAQAFDLGYSNVSRYSSTLKKDVRYNAMRINDDYVVRLMIAKAAFWDIFKAQSSLLVVCMGVAIIIALVFANVTSKKLMKPISNISKKIDLMGNLSDDEDLSEDTYDELLPLTRAINLQRKEISDKMHLAKEAYEELEWILDSLNYGVFVVDSQNKILFINELAKDIFDTQEVSVLYDITYENTLLKNIEKIRASGSKMEFNYYREKNKKTYSVDIIKDAYLSNKDAIIVTFDDITEKTENLKIRQQFFTSASHELKTPVESINSLSKLVLGELNSEDEKLKSDMETIVSWSDKLKDVIHNILTITKAQERVNDAKVEAFSVAQSFEDVKKALLLKAKEKDIEILTKVDFSEKIETYKEDFLLVITNLLDNAVKFSPQGQKVEISASLVRNKLVVKVSDNGMGIAKGEQSRIFNRFYRSNVDDKMGVSSGSGLGLSIVKNVCLKNSWDIQVMSEKNKGSVFTLTIVQ